MYSYPSFRTPNTSHSWSCNGYFSRIAIRYRSRSPLAVYAAIIRDVVQQLRRPKQRSRLTNAALSIVVILSIFLAPLGNSRSYAESVGVDTAPGSSGTAAAIQSPSHALSMASPQSGNVSAQTPRATIAETYTNDVFLHKTTVGSYLYNGFQPAPEITDGDDNTGWADRNSYGEPTFRVDLGSEMPISRIRIKQTIDSMASWRVGVLGSADDVTFYPLTTTEVLTQAGWLEIPVPASVAYRYYQVGTVGSYPYYTVWGVETAQGFVGPPPPPPPPGDIFLGKPTTGSAAGAAAVTDGDDATPFGDVNSSGDPFVRVDVGTTATIYKVRVLQHPNAYARSIRVEGSEDDISYTRLITATGLSGGWVNVSVPSGTPYRYYRVYALDLVGGYTSAWIGYTVQGFGDNTPWDSEGYGGCSCETRVHNGPPVDTAIGNFWHTFSDLSVPGRGFSLQLDQTYNAHTSNVSGTLGYGWTHSYDWYIDQDANSYYLVHQGNGGVMPFNPDMSHPLRVEATLTSTAGSLVLTTTHGLNTFVFHALDGSNTAGKLDHITDRNGYTTSLSYNANGQLQTVTDSANRTLTFSYTSGLLTSVTDPANRTVSFHYNASNELWYFTDVGNLSTYFTYTTVGGYHQLLSMTDPNSGVLSNLYDASNRVISQTDPLNRTTLYGYYPSGLGDGASTTRITDTLGLVTVYYYSTNMLTQVVRNPGDQQQITRRSYQSGTTWPSEITDPNGNSTRTDWDNQGNVISTTDALTRTTQYAYNGTNDLTIITDTRGLTTTLGYDAYGNVTTVSKPVTEIGQLITSTLTYDPVYHGDVLTVTNPLGNSWGMQYNQYGYVITATDPLTQSAHFSYNSIGWLLSSTDPRNYTSTYTYTTYGEPAIVADPLGYTSVYTYDNVGNLINARDANGHVITNTYDLANEPIRATKADGTHSDYGYDGLGRTITMTNGLGQLTRYSYDDINRVVTSTDALTRSTVLHYDLAGVPTSLTDAKGQTTSLSYDAAYQLLGIDYSDSGTHDVQYAHNSMGARTAMTDGVGTTLYNYDSLLRPTSITDGLSHAVTYTYDLASRLTGITYPYNGSSVRSVSRGYDNANQLTSVTDWFTNTSNFAYDADGNLTTITRPNSATTRVGYNGADEAITMTQAITATPFLSLTFQVDPVGVLTKTTEANTAGSAGVHNYSYDTRNRLTNDTNVTNSTFASTWQYDAATQILQTTYRQQGIGITQPITTTRTYDAANQLGKLSERTGFNGGTLTKNISYTFDANGNRTQRYDSIAPSTTNYTYDQADRLTGAGMYAYAYNGDGLRMSKSSLQTTQYTWDVGAEAGLPLLLQDKTGSYIYGPGGMLLEDVVGTSSTDVYYYHGDRQGSVRALTSSTGAVSNTYTYDAYGKTLTSTDSVSNPFKYTGEYTDQESGFIYLRARYYDPESQQFLTVDPALAWTEEAYAYVGGSPANSKDPSGLQVIDEGEAIVEGAGEGIGNVLEGAGEVLTEGLERLFEENAETAVAPKIEVSLNLPESVYRYGRNTANTLTPRLKDLENGGGMSLGTEEKTGFCFASDDLLNAGFTLDPDRPGHVTLRLGEMLTNKGYTMWDWAMTKEDVLHYVTNNPPTAVTRVPGRYGLVDILAKLGVWKP